MRKVVIARPGGHSHLKLEQHPSPPLGPGQVRISVAAIGVNFADIFVRLGLYASAKRYVGWPITPGFEVAGSVSEVAPDVEGVAPGDEVFGVTRFGAYATEVVVPRYQVFARPAGWSTAQAAAFPTVFLSAYHALFNLAAVRPGSEILVHSAAGGVGSALLQLSRVAQCRAVGVVGASHKVAVASRFGARVVIDKSEHDLWRYAEAASPDGYDAIFDGNGPATLAQSYAHLRPVGRLITYGFHSLLGAHDDGLRHYLALGYNFLKIPRFHPLALLNDNRSVMAFNLSFLFHRADLLAEAMDRLIRWVEQGHIKPPKVETFALADVAAAHQTLESGQTTGKLVLVSRQARQPYGDEP